MIELDEKDVKAVGRSRFVRNTSKSFNIILISCLVLFLVLAYYLREFSLPISFIPTIPIFGILGYMVWYVRAINKAEKYLVAKWKDSNGH